MGVRYSPTIVTDLLDASTRLLDAFESHVSSEAGRDERLLHFTELARIALFVLL